jgi:RimJ/RimL family protein N-acetyltransferase
LIVRKPRREDADAIFTRYASDADVTRLVGWPTQTSVDATRAFLELSDAEWERWPAGPYLVQSRRVRRSFDHTAASPEFPPIPPWHAPDFLVPFRHSLDRSR